MTFHKGQEVEVKLVGQWTFYKGQEVEIKLVGQWIKATIVCRLMDIHPGVFGIDDGCEVEFFDGWRGHFKAEDIRMMETSND